MKTKLPILFLTFLLFSTNAFCGFLIEPYVGYASLKEEGTTGALGITERVELEDSTTKGPIYGGRLGYGIANLGFGFDYTGGSLDNDGDTVKFRSLGGFVMAKLPLVRLWATYVFGATETIDDPDLGGEFQLRGKGTKFGIGFTPLPLLSLNIEYMSLTYDDENSAFLNDLDYDSKGLLFSVSLPLVF